MNSLEYDRIRKSLLAEAEKIQTAKRPGYTQGDTDVLKNFKSVGERVKTTKGDLIGPSGAWSVYFLKHIDAIMSILNQPHLPVSEDPLGRFADAINYLQLGYALYVESRQGSGQATRDLDIPEMLKRLEDVRREQAKNPSFPQYPQGGRGAGSLPGAVSEPFLGGYTTNLPVVPKTIDLRPVETAGHCGSDPGEW